MPQIGPMIIVSGVVLFLLWWLWPKLFPKKPCFAFRFRIRAEMPSLVQTPNEARELARHNQSCFGCDEAMQAALDEPFYRPKGMYAVWQHITPQMARRLKDQGFVPRQTEPQTDAEIHAALCRNCAKRVREA